MNYIHKGIKMLARIICLLTITFCASVSATVTNLDKKTVLITGGLSGMGKDIAMEFKNAGWNVWVTSRNPSQYETLSGVTVRKLDVTNQAEIKRLLTDIKAKDGRLDVLVNNAGYGIVGPTETISAAQARNLMDVNVIGPFLLMQAALPVMRANHGGHIINISSTSALRALPGLGIYAASKMALEGLSEAVAAETGHWNIQVSIIEPGTVNNDWAKNAVQAENLKEYPGYKTFTNNLRSSLQQKSMDAGQQPEEVAQLALKIANTPKPDLRYQTNSTVSALAHEVLVDPTGNKMRDQTSSWGRELYQTPIQ